MSRRPSLRAAIAQSHSRSPTRKLAFIILGLVTIAPRLVGQSVIAGFDADEKTGDRPYEMVWADRRESATPTLRFDSLEGWTLPVEGGAQATLQSSRAQDVWGRPVARLRYRGAGKADSHPRIQLVPPQPVLIPDGTDSVDLWVYGNRWSWENPPDTPPLRLVLQLRDGNEQPRHLPMDSVRWKEWWLVHQRLPRDFKPPLRLEGLECLDGWQSEWREIFLDSVRFYHEEMPPLSFAPRPKRNLELAEGQSRGANIGPGKLSFPTRAKTILPLHGDAKFSNEVRQEGGGYIFTYRGDDCFLAYRFDPALGLSSLRAEFDGSPSPRGASVAAPLSAPVGGLLDGAKLLFVETATNAWLQSARLERGVVTASYSDNTTVQLQIWQKSLVLDVQNLSGQATELNFGRLTNVTEPRTILVPYLTYGGGARPCVLLSRAGTSHVFTSLWLDWYRSNGSEPFAAESAGTNTASINGGVRYLPRTDGRRNPLFERVFITVSPKFEEVLPTVPNPVGLHAGEAVDRLWQESWGPDDFERQMKRSRMLRAYGIEKLIQCNHEITWRDGGESFTLRTRAAPK
jgi:hypothetical protein